MPKLFKKKKGTKEKVISIGDKVKIKEVKKGTELTVSIVGTIEADIAKSKISNESPVGKALIGNKKDDVVEVTTKIGIIQYKILDIVR